MFYSSQVLSTTAQQGITESWMIRLTQLADPKGAVLHMLKCMMRTEGKIFMEETSNEADTGY
jgi:hypothetical protein